jgi:hypothetical protein
MHGNDNKSGAVILRAALAMSRELGKDVVAVGIEREDDVAYLRALGCEYAQGFYFGEPMSEREVMNLLNALARSSKREEKREKKKPKKDMLALPSRPDLDDGSDDMEEIAPEDIRSGLPVPTANPGRSSPAREAKRGGGLFRKLGGFARAGSAQKEKIGLSISGAFRSLSSKKKPAAKQQPESAAKQRRPQQPDMAPMEAGAPRAGMPGQPSGNDAAALRERLAQMDRPVRRPMPDEEAEAMGNFADPAMGGYDDLRQGQRERRRRGQTS